MDHKQIDQFNLIDRYLMGKLLAEETAGFEEHFVDCPQCIARLQTTKNFMQDLRFVAAEQASQVDRRQPRRAFGYYLQTLLRKPLALAVGCLLIAVVAGTFFLANYTRRLRTEVNQAKSLSEQWQRRYEDERQSADSADRKHQETELQRTEQLRALEAKLKDEEAQRTKMATELSRWMRPEGSQHIFILSSVRGNGQNAAEAVNNITLSRAPAMFAFSIPLEDERRYKTYRATIFDDHRRLILKNRRLTQEGYNSLSVILNSSLFRPGHYSLIVEGVKEEGGEDVVGNYPFLITKTL
jgi:hypothetical protein